MIILVPGGPGATSAQITWLIDGHATDAFSVTAQVDRLDTGVNVVPAGAAVLHAGVGVYVYAFGALDLSLPYRVTWTVTAISGAVADVVTQDVWPTDTVSPTLADVERELAARVGNHWVDTVASADSLHISTLFQTSNIPLGGWADLWVLRRGVFASARPSLAWWQLTASVV
jgi:hypothetical protein